MNSPSEPANGAISLQNVSKHFKLYHSALHRLSDMLLRRKSYQHCWALRNISIAIQPGETVGLLGVNGSGKSTLLHLIAGTRTVTAGEIDVAGRVSSLLELGVGFHSEWTGRENVLFYLRLRNIARCDIAALVDEIEAFADIGAYFDQPLRSCSTGMMMRVAFAAAALVEADIFIVDEALAVGDAVFQHKCFQYFEVLRARGVTILFVTHQPGLIAQICSRALILDKGELVFDGEPREATERYLALATRHQIGQADTLENPDEIRFGTRAATITAIDVTPPVHGGTIYRAGDIIVVRISARFETELENPAFGFSIKTLEGVLIYSTASSLLGLELGRVRSGDCIDVILECPLELSTGVVFLDFSIFISRGQDITILDARLSAAKIEIMGTGACHGIIDARARMALTSSQLQSDAA